MANPDARKLPLATRTQIAELRFQAHQAEEMAAQYERQGQKLRRQADRIEREALEAAT